VRGTRTSLSSNRHAWLLPLSAALVCVAIGCQLDSRPGTGLIVAADTNLALPKDIDRVQLTVKQGTRTLASVDVALASGKRSLPTELRVPYPGNHEPVLIRGIAYKDDVARIERSALTPVPDSRWGVLHLPLDYLCEGTVQDDGTSTCGPEMTCRAGTCGSATLPDSAISDYAPAAFSGGTGSDALGSCFDVTQCLANGSEVALDSDCSFELNPDASADHVNVALRLAGDADGTCSADGCFVPIDSGADGFSIAAGRVSVPSAICQRRSDGQDLSVVVSAACATKTPDEPICSADATPTAVVTAEANGGGGSSLPTNFVGDACAGANAKACEQCGTSERVCTNGQWDDYGACEMQGECTPDATLACGDRGLQVCGGDCQWGPCSGQTCEGSSTRACERCGTQRRSCDNGTWGAWSACGEQSVCNPNDTQACGSGGTQGCGGNCQWGACGDQSCPGAPSEACGNCGSHSRSCDASSGKWSDYAACSGEGACAPNDTRTCGQGGTESCGGDCQWSGVCSGQSCSGNATRACENCGTQTRSCDSTSGEWSDWGPCNGGGECSPDQTRGCGQGGTQVCGGSCQWSGACTGQSCRGSNTQTCGNCGSQTRSCDSTSGRWSDWGDCSAEGECQPNATDSCGQGGTKVCGTDCHWGSACDGQMCGGAASRTCGNCGLQTRSCDASTGTFGNWSSCQNQGACKPGDSQACGNSGTQTCTDMCQWNSQCQGQVCLEPAQRACGNCGIQTSTCDPNTGRASWSNCSGEGKCAPGQPQGCGAMGMRVCGQDCQWPSTCAGQMCAGANPSRGCGNCGTESSVCDPNSATWSFSGVCMNQGACMLSDQRACGSDGKGTLRCGQDCQWGDCTYACDAPPTRTCGNCNTGSQTSSCDATTGQVTWSACTGATGCTPGASMTCSSANQSGTRICAPDCTLPTACTFSCGPTVRACGSCSTGMQMGTCDQTTGSITWGACVGGGCTPGASEACTSAGLTGTHVCTAACSFPNTCDFTCGAPLSRPCGNCNEGTQSGTCNPATGQVEYGACVGGGECAVGDTRACTNGVMGTESCSATCTWPGCARLFCSAPLTKSCGNCLLGTQTGTCDPNTGQVTYGACVGAGACAVGDTMVCDGNGTLACSDACVWSDLCVHTCSEPLVRACGNCSLGTQTGECNVVTGQVDYDDCNQGNSCMPNTARVCDGTGAQVCGNDCAWGMCEQPIIR
jgi:hypothetical protein